MPKKKVVSNKKSTNKRKKILNKAQNKKSLKSNLKQTKINRKPTKKTSSKIKNSTEMEDICGELANGISSLLEEARHQAARAANAILTAAYWETGRRIIEFEQNGERRAEYGTQLLIDLSGNLTTKLGRGFGVDNLQRMRAFFLAYPSNEIYATSSRKSFPIPSSFDFSLVQMMDNSSLSDYLLTLSQCFPLSWSHYVRLLSVKTLEARKFYEMEAKRGGWSVRQLDRQISSLFYERTALSKNKVAMLMEGSKPKPEDLVTVEEEIKDPFVLEFLGLKDEYSESELEEALIHHLESFLLELGNDFTFAGRQKRLRIGDTWYRIDLLLYHRRLRCLVIIDLKVGKFSHADAGQMNLYLNYAWEHLTLPEENPPVGLILCSEHDKAAAHYALGNLVNKVMAAEYRLSLPNPEQLEKEIDKTRQLLQKLQNSSLKTKKNKHSSKNR